VQNADVLLDLGSRLGIRQVSYNWKLFARNARIIQVDIDCAELKKPTLQPHFPICSHLKPFLEAFNRQLEQDGFPKDHYAGWLQRCKATLTRYPAVTPQQRLSEKLNPYVFCEKLSEHLSANDVVACGNGSAFIMSFQAAKVKEGQRWFFNNGSASMGYDLPAAIGACFACGEQRVVCMAGDGSIMMNLQELQTIAHHRLPVKVFILCNGGYLSIRQSEMGFFGRLSGADATSGVSFPDYGKLASAFGIQTLTIEKTNVDQAIDEALNCPGPVVCSVIVDPDQMFEPRSSSKQLPDGRIISPSIEDMYPFLDRQEMTENMVLPPLDPE
jgi:acetolactate synthase-1/2/3 large subunit